MSERVYFGGDYSGGKTVPMTAHLMEWPGSGKLEAAFWEFHRSHPEVYEYLVRFARQWRGTRPDARLGIAMLFERVRWEIALNIAERPTLNNNHRAFYARLIMKREPDLADAFHLRRQRVQSSIGPENEALPEGTHLS